MNLYFSFTIFYSDYSIVDGHWGQWTEWTGCFKCNEVSQKTRARACTDPAPDNGYDPCNADEAWETETCNADESMELCIPASDCYFDGPCIGWDIGGWQFNSETTTSATTGPKTDYTGIAIPSVGRLHDN